MVVLEVPPDGVGASVEALGGKPAAQVDDQVDGGLGDRRR
jgi:hypothetical protein